MIMAKQFKLGNQIIEVSDELEQYNELRFAYTGYADQATNTFHQLYVRENSSLEDLAANCEQEAYEALGQPVTEGIRLLIPQGIYDIDQEIFLEDYCDGEILPVMGVCDKYIKQYNRIKAQQAAEKQYRRDRRANRSRLIVGGFGLGGLMKGVGISKLYDAATWVAHSAFNAIGNLKTDIAAAYEQDRLFYDPNTKREFLQSMWESAFNIHYAYIRAVEQYTGTTLEKYDPADVRRALAINNNICLLLPDQETVEKMTAQMLSLSPYDVTYYANLIRNYGDEKGELQQIGEFFHIDMDALKKDILHEYASRYSYRDMESPDEMMSDLKEKAVFYGMNTVPKKTALIGEKNGYDNWRYAGLLDKDTRLYLSEDISKKNLMTAMTKLMKEMRIGVQAIFDKYYDSATPHIIGPNALPNGVWFALSENTETMSTILFAARDGLHFGRGKTLAYRRINSIEVNDERIILNEAIRLSYRAEGIDTTKLKSFLDELVSFFNSLSTQELVEALDLSADISDTYDEQKKVLEILKTHQKNMWRVGRNITVFDASDPSHILALKNIKSRWHILQNKPEPIAPVFWTWSGEDHVIFTAEDIRLMANGLRIPYKDILNTDCYLQDGKILLDYDDLTHVIMDEPCDDPQTLTNLLNQLMHALGGKDCEAAPSGRYTYETDIYMEDFDRELTDYLLTRVGDDSRNDFSQFLLMEHYDQSFTYMVELFRDRCPELDDEPVLCILTVGYDAAIITREHVYPIRQGRKAAAVYDLSEITGFATDYSQDFKPMSLCAQQGDSTSQVYLFNLSGNPFVGDRAVYATRIANMALDYVRKKEGLPVQSEETDLVVNVRDTYANYAPDRRLSRRLSYWGQSGYENKNGKWTPHARESFFSAGAGEKIIYFYNGSRKRAGSTGIVLTNRSLYLRGKQPDRADLDEIVEYRGVTRGGTHYIELGLKDGETRRVYFRHIPDFDVVSDMLSDLIFLTKNGEEDAAAAFDHDDFVAARRHDRRSIPGEMNDEQREAIQILSDFCVEHQIFGEESEHEILFNDGSDEFNEAYQKAVSESSERPDPIEIPIFLIRRRKEKKKLFGRGSDTIILTNEAWYNVASKGALLPTREKVSARLLKDVVINDETWNSGCEFVLVFEHEENTDYVVLKTNDGGTVDYKDFFIFVREQDDSLAGIEDLAEDEKEALIRQTDAIAEGCEQLPIEEATAHQEELLAFPWECSVAAEEKLEARVRSLATKELDTLTGSIETLSAEETVGMRQKLLDSPYPERYTRPYRIRTEAHLKELNQKKAEDKIKTIREIIDQSKLASPVFGDMSDRRICQMAESLLSMTGEVNDGGLLNKFMSKVQDGAASVASEEGGKAGMGGLLNKAKSTTMNAAGNLANKVQGDDDGIAIDPWDVPLIAGIAAEKSGYIITEDKFITYGKHRLHAFPVQDVEGFVVADKIVTQSLSIRVGGKSIAVTGIHGKRSEEYARVLSQVLDYLKTGAYKPAESYEIEVIRGNDTINKMSNMAADKAGAVGNAVAGMKPSELAGRVPDAGDIGGKISGMGGKLKGFGKGDKGSPEENSTPTGESPSTPAEPSPSTTGVKETRPGGGLTGGLGKISRKKHTGTEETQTQPTAGQSQQTTDQSQQVATQPQQAAAQSQQAAAQPPAGSSPAEAPAQEFIICKNCGNKMKPGKNFCGKCGTKVE